MLILHTDKLKRFLRDCSEIVIVIHDKDALNSEVDSNGGFHRFISREIKMAATIKSVLREQLLDNVIYHLEPQTIFVDDLVHVIRNAAKRYFGEHNNIAIGWLIKGKGTCRLDRL